MKNTWFLSLLIIVLCSLPLLSACPAETTPTPASTPTQTTPASSPTSTPEAHWWDDFGEPQYGGTLTRAVTNFGGGFDPYNWQNAQNSVWYEPLWLPDWLEDPSSGIFAHMWVPPEHWTGNLAEDWEWSDPTTLVIHLRQDIKWQDKSPVNGREFVADDVVFHYDRMFGAGDFTEDGPNPFFVGRFANCESVTSSDKYTVIFKFKQPNEFLNLNSIMSEPILQFFEAREVYEMGTPIQGTTGINSALNDWQNQVGTGPFILTDFVDGTSQTLVRNPDYWCYDERHPENQLPYVDTIKVLCIPDQSTQIASLRSGRLDIAIDIPLEQALNLQETNPDLQWGAYASPGTLLQLRCDTEPFNDIRVRKALQLAVNLPELAETYYKGMADPTPVGVINPAYEGFANPYEDWPQELKDEYVYNPEKAKQLLAEAGYPDGFETNTLAAAGGPGGDLQLLQVLKAYFETINVDMEIQVESDFFALMQIIMAKKHDQMVTMGLSDDTPPYMGMRFYIEAEPSNGLCQNDPTWEALVQAVSDSPDKESLQAACREADDYWLQQHWTVTTFPLNKYVFWQPYVMGYSGEKADSWSFRASGLPRFWISE